MTIDLVRIVLWIIGLTISLVTVWSARKPIAATAYLLALFVGAISGVLAGMPGPTGRGIASALIVVMLPIVDMALSRALAASAVRKDDGRLCQVSSPRTSRSSVVQSISS